MVNTTFFMNDRNDIKKIILLLLISLTIVLTVKYFIYNAGYFKIVDESQYTSGLSQFSKNPSFMINSTIISGLGYIVVLSIFKILTGFNSLDAMNFFSSLISIIYLLILFGSFKLIFKDKKFAFLSSITVLLTSYFIEPMLEGRPQQIGMLLFLFYFVSLKNYLDGTKNKYTYLTLCTLLVFVTFIFHILSIIFLFLTFLIASCFLFCENKLQIRQIVLLLIPFTLPLLYFLSGIPIFGQNIFRATSGAIQWIFLVSPNSILHYFGQNFRILAPIGLLVLIISFPFFLQSIRYGYTKSQHLVESFRQSIVRHKTVAISLLFLIAIIFLYVQITYLPFEMSVYSSIELFLLMQSGNILFGLLYLSGIIRLFEMNVRERSIKYISIISLSLAILTGITILMSHFMGWNQVNYGIRFLGYWTIFAAPVVAFELITSKSRHPNKYVLAIIMFLIISINVLTASQAPQMMNIKQYWPYSTENALDWIRATEDKKTTYYILPESTYKVRNFILYYRSEYQMNYLEPVSEKQDNKNLLYSDGVNYVYT